MTIQEQYDHAREQLRTALVLYRGRPIDDDFRTIQERYQAAKQLVAKKPTRVLHAKPPPLPKLTRILRHILQELLHDYTPL